MKVIVEELSELEEIEVVIRCPHMDETVRQLIHQLDTYQDLLLCKKGRQIYQINIKDIMYVESIDDKTFIYLDNDVYENQHKLYEIEDILNGHAFVRISKSLILNLDYLKSVRALLNGKYEATLMNEEKLVINRSYMPSFKSAMGL